MVNLNELSLHCGCPFLQIVIVAVFAQSLLMVGEAWAMGQPPGCRFHWLESHWLFPLMLLSQPLGHILVEVPICLQPPQIGVLVRWHCCGQLGLVSSCAIYISETDKTHEKFRLCYAGP